MSRKVLVFDLDDTLYLERDYVRSGFECVGQSLRDRYGISGAGLYAWKLFKEGVRGDTFNRIAAKFELPQESVQLMVSIYREHEPMIALEPDAEKFLDDLEPDVIGTGIITDGFAAGQWKKVRALGLDQIVDHIIVTGDHGREWTKPSRKPFERIESSFPAGGVEFTYFGDNPMKDFEAPRELGWRTVRVRRPPGLHFENDIDKYVDATVPQFGWDMAPVANTLDNKKDALS